MATNNPYNNDPYNEMDGGSTIRDFAMGPYRPSNWMWAYGHVPSLWSIEKGLYVPFIGRHIETGGRFIPSTLRHIGQSYQGRGFIGGTVTAARRTIGALHKGGPVGKRFFTRGTQAAEGFNQLQAGIRPSLLENNKLGLVGRELDDFTEVAARRVVSAARSGRKTVALTRPGVKGTLGSISVKKSMSRLSKSGSSALLKGGLSAAAMRTPLKLALGVGKGMSMIGAATLAWDMAKMVGEPLGAYAMGQADNALTKLQDRFMPEMGGDLSIAYLSREAATERQRAMQAMSKAYITGRSAFGQEAMMQHR